MMNDRKRQVQVCGTSKPNLTAMSMLTPEPSAVAFLWASSAFTQGNDCCQGSIRFERTAGLDELASGR
jgi:hypothetical protein